SEPETFASDCEAILSNNRVIHAEGPARRTEAQASLREAAQRADAARGKMRWDDPAKAVSFWHALVSGRWTLVNHFDDDGRKFLVARRNDPAAVPHARLSPRETQVAALAAFGHPNKVIAYELGIALSTVATLLQGAVRKLGLTSRLELIQVFLSTVSQ